MKKCKGETLSELKVKVSTDLNIALFGGSIIAKLLFCA